MIIPLVISFNHNMYWLKGDNVLQEIMKGVILMSTGIKNS